jgi:two-component system nitrate/nitrite response regulator NarL
VKTQRVVGDPLRVVLADDHELVRGGVRRFLETHTRFRVCGEATNGQEAVDMVVKFQPQLVLLDVSMPTMNGLQVAAKIRELQPGTKIIMLTVHNSEQLRAEAKRQGADGFVAKSKAATNLLKTILELFHDLLPDPGVSALR